MRKFVAGFFLGFLLAGGGAWAANCFGEGYLMGWTVTMQGDEVCSDPFVWAGIKEIECE
jgi:hypothetical protein